MTVSEWKVYPCVTCALRLHERCGLGCSRWNDSKTERSPGFFWQAGGARQTVSLYVSTHTAEPTARPSSKMWQYLATEQHCCTSLKSNFKGYNSPGQVMTPSASLLRWQLRCLLEQRIHSGFFIYSPNLYCDWWGRGRGAREAGTERRGDGASERGYAWNGVRRLCLRQICLVELQMPFLFTCLRMPSGLIVFQFSAGWFLSHNSSALGIMSIHLWHYPQSSSNLVT